MNKLKGFAQIILIAIAASTITALALRGLEPML